MEARPAGLFVSDIHESEPGDDETGETVAAPIVHRRERLVAKLEEAVAVRADFPPVPPLADRFFTVMEGGFPLLRALDDRTHTRTRLAHLRHYLELLFGFSP